jgi:hypothetical protein
VQGSSTRRGQTCAGFARAGGQEAGGSTTFCDLRFADELLSTNFSNAAQATHDNHVCQVHKQAMFHDPGSAFELFGKLRRVLYRAEIAVENQVALIGAKLFAVFGKANSASSPESFQISCGRSPPEGQNFHRQSVMSARSVDNLLSSTTITSRAVLWATSFSLSRAPPPPLIKSS